MLRRRTSMGVGLLALAASLAAHGCAEDSASLVVACVGVPQSEDDGCTVEADVEACQLSSDWNLEANLAYNVSLVLQSGLVERESDIPLRAETNGIIVTEMVVTLRNPAGNKLPFQNWPNPYTIKVAGFVPPGGLGVSNADIVPQVYVKDLVRWYEDDDAPLRQIVADIQVRGRTQGDESIVVADWSWPIELHNSSLRVADRACFIPEEDEAVCGDPVYFLCRS